MLTNWTWANEWNWHTEDGREFCRTLKRDYGLAEKDDEPRFHWKNYDANCREYGLFHRSDWCVYEPSCGFGDQVAPEPERPDLIADDEEHERQCMLCEDAPADTMVLPCEHRVVCAACSAKLNNTGYSKKCVACTRPITMVLVDNADPINK